MEEMGTVSEEPDVSILRVEVTVPHWR